MKKILLICNVSNSVITFRKKLIEKLISENYEVYAIAFDDTYKTEIEEMGVKFYCVNDKNRSINPFKVLALKSKYKKIIKQINPDVVFTFMLKPNVFGVPAAKSAGVKDIYAMVEGAGDVFINNGLKWKVIRAFVCMLYKNAFSKCKKVFFLNKDDKAEFLKRKLVKGNQIEFVYGIGVDLQRFENKPVKTEKTFLMIARMLTTKGVIDYLEAAKIVKQKHPDATFNYLGGEGTLKISDIQSYIDEGIVNYLGTTKDVRPFLENCTAYVLPSYREGMSVSIMEAEAVGRPIITYDTVGCRDTINGENGILVDFRNVDKLAESMIYIIENYEEAVKMGENARKFAENNFDSVKITQYVFDVINNSEGKNE